MQISDLAPIDENVEYKTMIPSNKSGRQWSAVFRPLICGVALTAFVLASPNMSHRKQKQYEYSAAPLFDTLPLPTKIDFSSLAAALAQASGKTVVVVLPQETQNALLESLGAAKQPLNWKEMQQLLQQAGAVVGTGGSDVVVVAQGTAYPLLDQAKGACLTGEIWKAFSDSYSQLTPDQQSALASPDGLLLDTKPE